MGTARPPVPGIYQHYKGTFYEVLGVAQDPESGHDFVVYRSLGLAENLLGDPDPAGPALASRVIATSTGGALAVCSIDRFTEPVSAPGGGKQQVPRFKLVARLKP